ncbi:MAG TPA: FCD domain-containing protein [Deltaproteobacteria bacterium]|nr:FCD domain-containing protein [Deltaproteobacteria bacterium]HOI06330.1 FCD domain-containing protein [Deltaproteobacteria bacterium]
MADQIMGLIKSGKIKPGERLPSEEKMTRLLGISRITLREAKKLLEAKGYLKSGGKGSTYTAMPVNGERSSIEDLVSLDQDKIWELLEVRRILDSGAAAMASVSATRRDVAALRAIHARAVRRRLAEKSPLEVENASLYARFFDKLMESTHNTIFVSLRRSVNTLLLGAFPYGLLRLSSVRESSRRIIEQMGSIVDAIENRDPGAAKHAMLAHIDYLKRAMRKPS